jgi:hypothetical protein
MTDVTRQFLSALNSTIPRMIDFAKSWLIRRADGYLHRWMHRVSGKLRLANATVTAAVAAAVLAPGALADDTAPPLSSVLPKIPAVAEVAAVVDAAVAAMPSTPVVAAQTPAAAAPAPVSTPQPAAEPAKADPAPPETASAPTAGPEPAAEAPKARDTTSATSAIAKAVDTAVNSAQYHGDTTQYQPSNIVVIVRIDSPGNDGPITQTNTAITSIVTTVTQTVESVATAAAATVPAPAVTLPAPVTQIVPIELLPPLPLPLPRVDVPVLSTLPAAAIALATTPLPALEVPVVPVPVELPGFDFLGQDPLAAAVPARAGPQTPLVGAAPGPAVLPPWLAAPSFRAAAPFASAGADVERAARQPSRGAHAVPPVAQRPAPPTIPTQRVAGSAAAAAGGAGAGAAAVALIFAILAAYALVPPGGFRRLRRIRVRTPSGVDGTRRDRPG